MRTYKAFYKGKTCFVEASSSYEAQKFAAATFKARKSWEVAIVLCDTPLSTASL